MIGHVPVYDVQERTVDILPAAKGGEDVNIV